MDNEDRLNHNVTQLVGVSVLRKIRYLIDRDQQISLSNFKKSVVLLVVFVVLFTGIVFFAIQKHNAGPSVDGVTKQGVIIIGN